MISCSRSSVSNSRRSVSRRHACASSARFETPPTTTCPPLSPCCAVRSVSATSSSRSRCSRASSAASFSSRACASVYVSPRSASSRRSRLAQRLIVERLRPVEDPLVHAAVLADGEDHHRRPHVDQLQANDRLLGHRRRNRETGVLRQPREQLHASLQDLLEVEDRLGEIARDRAPLRVRGGGRPRGASRRSAGSRCRWGCGRRWCAGG